MTDSDTELVAKINELYREGRRACIRIGQLLEDKRVSLGGTSRGGVPVKSRFWTWFDKQDFPFSRNTAENYLLFARDPSRYTLHCEKVRARSAKKQVAFEESQHDLDRETVRVGLPIDVYDAMFALAKARNLTINDEIATACREYLQRARALKKVG